MSHPVLTAFISRADALISSLSLEVAAFLLLATWINRSSLSNLIFLCLPRSLRVNVTSFVVDGMVVTPLLGMAIAGHAHLTLPDFGLFGGPIQDAPPWLILILAIFIGDFVGYFRHRLEHTKLVWPTHVLHHSDREMTWFSLYRFHPLNRCTTVIIDVGVMLGLGFPIWAIFTNGLIRHYYGLLIHSNLPWTYGRLGRLFVSPAMHRWHHVRKGEEVGKNFATIFSIFDQVFGTFYLPSICDEPLGTEEPNHRSYTRQLIDPFRTWASFLLDLNLQKLWSTSTRR